jgi:hypothetical protein
MRAGRAKGLAPEAAIRLDELAAPLPAQRFPISGPTDDAELDVWSGARGRLPEFLVHDRVEESKRLWRQVGFRHAPHRGHRLSDGTFAHLYSPEGIVGEVKNIVGPNWGPRQLRQYMRRLDVDEPQRAPWRGVLVHGEANLSVAARRAIADVCTDGSDVSVWSIRRGRWSRYRAVQQYP